VDNPWFWVGLVVVVFLAVMVWRIGVGTLRRMGDAARAEQEMATPETAEDVADLDVFFVCSNCGTEYQVTRLGEVQVPRHCGEPMDVVRRPPSA
jgi:hypothetical protein